MGPSRRGPKRAVGHLVLSRKRPGTSGGPQRRWRGPPVRPAPSTCGLIARANKHTTRLIRSSPPVEMMPACALPASQPEPDEPDDKEMTARNHKKCTANPTTANSRTTNRASEINTFVLPSPTRDVPMSKGPWPFRITRLASIALMPAWPAPLLQSVLDLLTGSRLPLAWSALPSAQMSSLPLILPAASFSFSLACWAVFFACRLLPRLVLLQI